MMDLSKSYEEEPHDESKEELEKQIQSVEQAVKMSSIDSCSENLSLKDNETLTMEEQMKRIQKNIANVENVITKCKYATVTGKFEPDESISQRDDQSQSGMSMKLRM